jgi:hypothetical protein
MMTGVRTKRPDLAKAEKKEKSFYSLLDLDEKKQKMLSSILFATLFNIH